MLSTLDVAQGKVAAPEPVLNPKVSSGKAPWLRPWHKLAAGQVHLRAVPRVNLHGDDGERLRGR